MIFAKNFQEIMKKNNTWNIRRLFDESVQWTSVIYCRLANLMCWMTRRTELQLHSFTQEHRIKAFDFNETSFFVCWKNGQLVVYHGWIIFSHLVPLFFLVAHLLWFMTNAEGPSYVFLNNWAWNLSWVDHYKTSSFHPFFKEMFQARK